MEHIKMINALSIEPGKDPILIKIKLGYESIQEEIGGYFAAMYPFKDAVALLVDEEGLLKRPPYNRIVRNKNNVEHAIMGQFLVVGVGES